MIRRWDIPILASSSRNFWTAAECFFTPDGLGSLTNACNWINTIIKTISVEWILFFIEVAQLVKLDDQYPLRHIFKLHDNWIYVIYACTWVVKLDLCNCSLLHEPVYLSNGRTKVSEAGFPRKGNNNNDSSKFGAFPFFLNNLIKSSTMYATN